jgi:Glycosyl hydrolases family 35
MLKRSEQRARYHENALLGIVLFIFFITAGAAEASSSEQRYGCSRITQHNGYPVFSVDGKPFFVYGAAFFYERLPRDMWHDSMVRLRAVGINTLDLYVPWNWHELSNGNFDFDGRTNPRRDLHTLMRFARELQFKIILRPGPVIRNEWRNGGYPAWLLERPEYGMPLHDLLEGRYPPTATLQNANADDAAQQWMRNATHMRYARRWLTRVLTEFKPIGNAVIAVQLDDDQGAYIDNQTWPAPHLRSYVAWLASVVHAVTGPAQPVFINTFDMKVPASSPVWAMGNWYQSDTYAIGEHDRTELAFATGLLQTQTAMPLMYSEFQAGWLQQPGDVRPRAADPANTLLAMGTLLGMGARGIVNFPAQDTLYPAGMEAPFANAFYAWDAALTLDGTKSARYAPTHRIGELISAYGEQLAGAHVVFDAAIAYLTSAFDETKIDNHDIAQIAAYTRQAQSACRAASLACALVDLRFTSNDVLQRYPLLIVPMPAQTAHLKNLNRTALGALQRYVRSGGTILALTRSPGPALPGTFIASALTSPVVTRALLLARHERVISFAPGASFTENEEANVGFFLLPNYTDQPQGYDTLTIVPDHKHRITLHHLSVAARDMVVTPIALSGTPLPIPTVTLIPNEPITTRKHDMLPISSNQELPISALRVTPSGRAQAFTTDLYRDGEKTVILQNALVRVVIAPDAGARAFVFEDLARGTNVFDTVGALRDDVSIEPPLSTTDKIARYTHQFPAGMFNRPYHTEILSTGKTARVRFSYDAPDVLPHGAHFERTITLLPNARFFTVDQTASFPGNEVFGQRAVSVTSLTMGNATHTVSANSVHLYNADTRESATIAWKPGDVWETRVSNGEHSIVVRLTFTLGRTAHIIYRH